MPHSENDAEIGEAWGSQCYGIPGMFKSGKCNTMAVGVV